MQKVTLALAVMLLLPLAVLAQGNRFIRYNCLGGSDVDPLTPHSSSSRRKLPTFRTDWQADKTYRVPVILIEFADRQFSGVNPQATFDRIFNENGYNLGHGPGCVADYFREQSGGLFNPVFDVAGPVRVSASYKGSSSNNYGDKSFREAVEKADSLFNYADYDWDGVGKVPQVVFIYAGYGGNESSAKAKGCIWPNTSSFTQFYVDGVSFGQYTASAELWSTDELCGIGTICHEFSHCLGLPDVYPTAGSEFSVLDEWDLMDGGNYSDEGWCPPNYTVQEKELLGWFSARELDVTQTVSNLQPLEAGGDAYRITNSGQANEYYLLENRQQRGWDAFIPGHGLTVLHVDFNLDSWRLNTINSYPTHHRMDFVHACGHDYSFYEDIYGRSHYVNGRNVNLNGSAYPFVSDTLVVTELTDTSVPSAATLFNKNAQGEKLMGKPIVGIQESEDGLVSFHFFESVEAGIRTIPQGSPAASGIFNLQGQRLQDVPRRGVYVKNGRKLVVR